MVPEFVTLPRVKARTPKLPPIKPELIKVNVPVRPKLSTPENPPVMDPELTMVDVVADVPRVPPKIVPLLTRFNTAVWMPTPTPEMLPELITVADPPPPVVMPV